MRLEVELKGRGKGEGGEEEKNAGDRANADHLSELNRMNQNMRSSWNDALYCDE